MMRVTFPSSQDLIQGYIFPCAKPPALASVIFLQGFPGMEGDELICEDLAQAGAQVLTFNYRGTFQSQGEFSFSHAVEDISAAIRFASAPGNLAEGGIDPARLVLGGWSFGSGILPAGAARHAEVRRLFMISGRDFAQEAQRIQQDAAYARQVTANLEQIRAPRGPVRFGDDLLADLVENRAQYEMGRLTSALQGRDILLVGGWDDSVAAIEDHLLPLYRALKQSNANRVRIRAIQDEHEFLNSRDELVNMIVSWLWANQCVDCVENL